MKNWINFLSTGQSEVLENQTTKLSSSVVYLIQLQNIPTLTSWKV